MVNYTEKPGSTSIGYARQRKTPHRHADNAGHLDQQSIFNCEALVRLVAAGCTAAACATATANTLLAR